MVKLSIIVPIYGVEQYLRKCVDSLLNQDMPSSDYEIILVDDGGHDKCPQICDDYAAAYENLRVIHRENGGLSAARNSGVEVARGEYVVFVDSDDYWEPNVLGGLMAQIERDNLDVLRFKYQNVRLKNEGQYEVFNPYKQSPYRDDDYSSEPTDGLSFLNTRMGTACYAVMFILRRDLIIGGKPSSNPLIHSSVNPLNNTLFTPGIYFEDTDWTPRMLAKAQRVASTDTIVYNYLVRQGSITKAIDRNKQKKVLEDKMRLIGELRRQAEELDAQGCDNRWYERMIADTVISVINSLSTTFYSERQSYISRLRELRVFPISSRGAKARLINFSPRLAVWLLHMKNG